MGELLFKERKRIWCGLPWTFTVYSFDEERFFIKRGMFTIKEDEIRLYRILDLSLKRNFIQRIFGMGTITVDSSDKSMKCFEIKNIKHSRDFKELLSQKIEEERMRKRISGREFISDHDHEDFDEYDEGYDHH
ncbi:MAG: PH domain-containing protein [Eubacterium sp.]|nr:PH domain-containing protein [Eubacterium sp.]